MITLSRLFKGFDRPVWYALTAGVMFVPGALASAGPAGTIVTVAGNGLNSNPAFAPDTKEGVAATATEIQSYAVGVGLDGALRLLNKGYPDMIYTTDASGLLIRVVGTLTLKLGNGGPAIGAGFEVPKSVPKAIGL
jgi:hypothetical protein